MREEVVQKVQKIGKVANVLINITKVLLIITLVGCVIGTVTLFVLPADFISMDINGSADMKLDLSAFHPNFTAEEQSKIAESIKDSNISVDNIKFDTANVTVDDHSIAITAGGDISKFRLGELRIVLISTTVYMIVLLVMFFFAGSLAKALRDCVSPFDEPIIQKMKALGFSMIPWVFLSGICEDNIRNFSNPDIGVSINLTALLVMLVTFALVTIFKYGAELQRETHNGL